LANAVGLAPSTIHRIWKAFSLQPHRAETFKLSTDPLFVEKVRDIVGLYLSPPERAIVLCVDEKSQIQALDRTQPLLPMRPGQVERRTHDYTRHGTLSLFAALDAATGRVIGKCFARHRAREFRAFLNVIEANVPADLDVHSIMERHGPVGRRASQGCKRHPVGNSGSKRAFGPLRPHPRGPPHRDRKFAKRCPISAALWLRQATDIFSSIAKCERRSRTPQRLIRPGTSPSKGCIGLCRRITSVRSDSHRRSSPTAPEPETMSRLDEGRL
jgi:transposase